PIPLGTIARVNERGFRGSPNRSVVRGIKAPYTDRVLSMVMSKRAGSSNEEIGDLPARRENVTRPYAPVPLQIKTLPPPLTSSLTIRGTRVSFWTVPDSSERSRRRWTSVPTVKRGRENDDFPLSCASATSGVVKASANSANNSQ